MPSPCLRERAALRKLPVPQCSEERSPDRPGPARTGSGRALTASRQRLDSLPASSPAGAFPSRRSTQRYSTSVWPQTISGVATTVPGDAEHRRERALAGEQQRRLDLHRLAHDQRLDQVALDDVHAEVHRGGIEEMRRVLRERDEQAGDGAGDRADVRNEGAEEGQRAEEEPVVDPGDLQPDAPPAFP